MGEVNRAEISRGEAERLILEAYSQMSAPVSELRGLSTGSGTEEGKTVREIYENYSGVIGGSPEGEIGVKIKAAIGPELRGAGNGEIQEILAECRELAGLLDLPVKREMPAGEIRIAPYFDKSLFSIRWNEEQQKVEWMPCTIEQYRWWSERRQNEDARKQFQKSVQELSWNSESNTARNAELMRRLTEGGKIPFLVISINLDRMQIYTPVDAVIQTGLPKRHPDGFLYFDNTHPQRIGGYGWFYELPIFTKNEAWCDIDAYRTNFRNTKGKLTSVWLWKGDYRMMMNDEDWCVGAEIGAYVGTRADDNILESGKFTLRRAEREPGEEKLKELETLEAEIDAWHEKQEAIQGKTNAGQEELEAIQVELDAGYKKLEALGAELEKYRGKVFLADREVRGQNWINGFVQGRNDEAANLIMDVHLVFYHEKDAQSYCEAFNKGVDKIDDKIGNRYFPANKGRNGSEGRRDKAELLFEPEILEPAGREVYFSWR